MTATHGGDLVGIGRAFARDPDSLLDFSASINPFGPPDAVSALLRAVAQQPSILAVYPDPHARELHARQTLETWLCTRGASETVP